eukprot:2854053-Pleurochrysis_carterae.AAC.1
MSVRTYIRAQAHADTQLHEPTHAPDRIHSSVSAPVVCADYMRDLPYDYTTLVENIIDPSHVPVSHHGTVQGNRELAQPLSTKIRSLAT